MKIYSNSNPHLSIWDRAAQFGDGCFTTMRVVSGEVEFWSAHLDRLRHSCQRLFIQGVNWQQLESEVVLLAKEPHIGTIKLIVSRGQSARGYGVGNVSEPTIIITASGPTDFYQEWQREGICIGEAKTRLAQQPVLAGLKHLNRLEQVLIKREVELSDFDDLLVTDTDDMLVETSVANLFWCKGDHWYTPSLEQAGIEGVMRHQVLAFLRTQSIPVDVVSCQLQQLLDVQCMFICNCLMQIVPIRQVYLASKNISLDLAPVKALQQAFRAGPKT